MVYKDVPSVNRIDRGQPYKFRHQWKISLLRFSRKFPMQYTAYEITGISNRSMVILLLKVCFAVLRLQFVSVARWLLTI